MLAQIQEAVRVSHIGQALVQVKMSGKTNQVINDSIKLEVHVYLGTVHRVLSVKPNNERLHKSPERIVCGYLEKQLPSCFLQDTALIQNVESKNPEGSPGCSSVTDPSQNTILSSQGLQKSKAPTVCVWRLDSWIPEHKQIPECAKFTRLATHVQWILKMSGEGVWSCRTKCQARVHVNQGKCPQGWHARL